MNFDINTIVYILEIIVGGLLVGIGVLMLLLALAAGCTSLVDPLPAGTGISPLQVVTPTPAHAQLHILGITTMPRVEYDPEAILAPMSWNL